MKLTVLGSGSSGNGYVLQNDNEALVLECAMPISDCLETLGWNVRKVAGCLLSHEHGDHARYIDRYMVNFPVYTSHGTAAAIKYKSQFRPIEVAPLRTFQMGRFSVRPIEAEHDSAEPFCYIIDHPETGKILFATDTYFIRYRIPGLSHLMIECNYSLELLNDSVSQGIVSAAQKSRTLESHMSLYQLEKMLDANDLSQLQTITLIHMSGNNGDKEAFRARIEAKTGIPTYVAEKGRTIEILKTAI